MHRLKNSCKSVCVSENFDSASRTGRSHVFLFFNLSATQLQLLVFFFLLNPLFKRKSFFQSVKKYISSLYKLHAYKRFMDKKIIRQITENKQPLFVDNRQESRNERN